MGNFLFYSVQCSVLIRSTTLNSLIFLDLTSNKRTKTVHFCAQLSSIYFFTVELYYRLTW